MPGLLGAGGSKTGIGAREASILPSVPHVHFCGSSLKQMVLFIKYHSRAASNTRGGGTMVNDYVTLLKTGSGAASQFP